MPLIWVAKQQKGTTRISAKVEVNASEKCVKELLRLNHILQDMTVDHMYLYKNEPIKLYNDNTACVYWSKPTTIKGILHITIRENAIREYMSSEFITVRHIGGDVNIRDSLTKKLKDSLHFIKMQDIIICILP